MSGWFAMKRGITSHHIFKGNPDRLAVWVWLLDNAAWKDTKHDINGHTVTIPRGSVAASERRIAEEVGVGRQAVRTFLDRLETDTMITRTLTHGRSVIRLCNWDKYQISEKADNPSKNPRPTQDQPIKETREQDITLEANASSGADAPEPVPVSILSKVLWDTGIRFLRMRGIEDAKARPIIGRWRSMADDATILSAIDAAHKCGTEDPVPYITKAIQPETKISTASLAERFLKESSQ